MHREIMIPFMKLLSVENQLSPAGFRALVGYQSVMEDELVRPPYFS